MERKDKKNAGGRGNSKRSASAASSAKSGRRPQGRTSSVAAKNQNNKGKKTGKAAKTAKSAARTAGAVKKAAGAVKTAAGKTGFVRDDAITRKEPNLENALDPKKVVDEADAYVKPVEQKARLEEWALPAADEPQKPIEGSDGPVQQNGEQANQEQTTQQG